jgi:hypothetical protein
MIPWIYDNVSTEYIINVYGSHFYPRKLLEQFNSVATENLKLAVFHDVVIYRYGDVVHRPILRRISSACVFFKKNIFNISNAKIHDEFHVSFNEKTMIRLPGRDDLSLHLFQDEDCESFIRKTINYQALEARQRFAAGERMGSVAMILGPLGRFIYQYFRAGSFVKGSKGLVYSILNFIYDLNVSIILWELSRDLTIDDAILKNAQRKKQLQKNGF